jgi:lipoprotein-releasing system ATP-binding protein
MNKTNILQCRQLTKRYDQGGLDVEVLKGVNLNIGIGERVAIMGASGSGKSTLLHLLGGLEKASGGEVVLDGVNINQVSAGKLAKLRNKSLGFIYQSHHLLGEFTVLENVAMPLLIGGESVKQARVRAGELLQRVGLGHRIEHKPGELSGGERQRAAVARALINKPCLILADEPTGNLGMCRSWETGARFSWAKHGTNRGKSGICT